MCAVNGEAQVKVESLKLHGGCRMIGWIALRDVWRRPLFLELEDPTLAA